MNRKTVSHMLLPVVSVVAMLFMSAPGQTWAQDKANTASTPAQALTLQELVQRLRDNNKTILSKKSERQIAATGIERAQGAFQPTANLSAVRGVSKQKNTYEEELIRQNLGVYEKLGTDYSAGVTQLLATGAKLEARAMLSRFITNNNQNDPLRPPGAQDNRSNVGLSVTQPLARDAGVDVTKARLRVAQMDDSAAEYAFKDTETSTVAEGIIAYHELVLAQQRVEAAREKLRNGDRLLVQASELNKQGRLSQSDVWEVQNALHRYQAALSEAQQGERERMNRLHTLLVSSASETQSTWYAVDGLPVVHTQPIRFEDSLSTALEKRDDFQMRKVQVDRENVQLAYSKNQALPRIDLVASYGLNGLEYSGRQSLNYANMQGYPSWTLGLQMNFPLGENRQAQADIVAAAARREDALLSLKALEVQIANDIDTSLGLRNSAIERWNLWKQVHDTEKKQLDLERAKFTAGRSDVREVLLRLERVVNAWLTFQEQHLLYAKADTLLHAAQNTLLEKYR
jgi:outer membrane protein TolC